ncbi:MAG TPA: ABC transporter substrate-binding protein [Candidatus Saccharimonadales bacterium]|nr:ABC transporter substrate-binding protein [Candidatus Saccharimonadales bacterium]
MPEDYLPRRVASLQPSITVTLRDLGLLDRLAACTKYCLDVCPELEHMSCVIVQDSWTAKAGQILAVHPDLVIASVPYQVEALTEIMKCGIPFLGLSPRSLKDVFHDIAAIAAIMGAAGRGLALVEQMQQQIEAVQKKLADAPRPLVYCEEWGKPLLHSQPWVAELVEAAGGKFLGEPGKQTTPEEVLSSNPEVIIAAWCGAGDRVPLEKIIPQRGWEQTRAAKSAQVYCINDEFLNTPATTLLHGLNALAAAIHPETFSVEKGLRRIKTVMMAE